MYKYIEIFELIIFVKCRIGVIHRVELKDMKNLNYYVSHSKMILEQLVFRWRKNICKDVKPYDEYC